MSLEKAKAVFVELVTHVPPEQWEARLADLAGEDEDLRLQVGRILAAHREAGSFLESPAPGLGGTIDDQPGDTAGTVLGPYKLIEEIGEGGMGTVWMAQQTEPVKRLVAVKLIKPGMDSKQVVARFEAERQALALMDHPNIAKVFDGGATPEGRPYFVMELVKGVPITRYCDEHRLTPRQRLELFVQVCQAIQHAHQKGIIHRDIKPSNVLVAPFDGKPVPKVIDFGVAKAAGQQLTERTLVTGFGSIIGTLEYMSPEQAELNNRDIDTRSDIYSLGVLLYELLTGTTPLDRQALKEAAFTEMLRIIREEEPPRPSTRLTARKDTLPTVSAQRHLEPAKLTRLVRGELDWIVMKALEKDRNRRYETANGFAADLQHYLNDEPVLACPPSAGYRLRKFARRNKARLAVASVLAVAVLVAMSAVGWAIRDRAARQAEAERVEVERRQRVAAQAELILDEVARLEREQKWPEALATAKRAEAVVSVDENDAATRTQVMEVIADLRFVERLQRIRMKRAIVIDGRLDRTGAEREYRQAFAETGLDPSAPASVESFLRRWSSRPSMRLVLASALDDWAIAFRAGPRATSADWRQLIGLSRQLDTDPDRDRMRATWGQPVSPELQADLHKLGESIEVREQLPETLVFLGSTLARADLRDDAIKLLRRAQQEYPGDFWINFELGGRLARTKSAEAETYARIAVGLQPLNAVAVCNLGLTLVDRMKLEEAIATCRKAIELDPKFALPYYGLGSAFREQNKLDEAIACYQKLIELNPTFGGGHNSLGFVLSQQNKLDEAIACYRTAIKVDPMHGNAHHNLGVALEKKGRLDEAIACYRQNVELNPMDGKAHFALGNALGKQDKVDEAIATFRKATELDPEHAMAWNNLGSILKTRTELDEAVAAFRKAIKLDPRHKLAWNNLGVALSAQTKLDEAVGACRTAIELDPMYANAYYNLGNIWGKNGRWAEAIACYRKAIDLDPKNAKAHNNLGNLLRDQEMLDEAIACLRMAIKLTPKNAQAHSNLGVALKAQGKLDEAIACYRTAIDLDPTNAKAHNNLGSALQVQDKLDEAIACFRKAIECDRKLVTAHFNLGKVLRAKNELDEAIASYRTAIELDPKDAKAQSNLGVALKAKGRLDEAIACYRKAIALDPKDAVAQNNLGSALNAQNQFNEAVTAFRASIELDPKYAKAHYNLGIVLRRLDRLDEAITCFRKAVQLSPKHADAHRRLAWHLCTAKDLKLRNPREAVELARRAIQLDPKRWEYWNTLSIACYRAADWKAALEARLNTVQRNDQGIARSWNGLGLAMIRWQLGEKEEARKAYDHVAEEATQHRELDEFRLEAEELLGIASTKKKAGEHDR